MNPETEKGITQKVRYNQQGVSTMIDATNVEGFKPTLRELTEREIDELALDALNMAIAAIQHHLGVTSGDIAGIFFSNGIVEHLLRNYVTAELEHGVRA